MTNQIARHVTSGTPYDLQRPVIPPSLAALAPEIAHIQVNNKVINLQ